MTKQSAFRCFDPLNEDDFHVCLQGQISTSEAIRSILDELDNNLWGKESLSIAVSCWLTEWQGLCVAAATHFQEARKGRPDVGRARSVDDADIGKAGATRSGARPMPKLTKQEIKKREQELMAFHRAQQRTRSGMMFTSSEAGGRGAVSPLGGVAKPASAKGTKR